MLAHALMNSRALVLSIFLTHVLCCDSSRDLLCFFCSFCLLGFPFLQTYSSMKFLKWTQADLPPCCMCCSLYLLSGKRCKIQKVGVISFWLLGFFLRNLQWSVRPLFLSRMWCFANHPHSSQLRVCVCKCVKCAPPVAFADPLKFSSQSY